MTEEQFTKAQELFETQYSLEKAIENAKISEDWHSLIDNFRRAGMKDFLGAFDIVKQRFISEVERQLLAVHNEIEKL